MKYDYTSESTQKVDEKNVIMCHSWKSRSVCTASVGSLVSTVNANASVENLRYSVL